MTRSLATVLGEPVARISGDADVSAGVPAMMHVSAPTASLHGMVQSTPGVMAQSAPAAMAQSAPGAMQTPMPMDLPRPLTTTTGHSAGSDAPVVLPKSRAPLVLGAIVGVAAIVGAVVFFTRGPTNLPTSTTVTDTPDPPTKPRHKDPAPNDPPPVSSNAVSSPPATSTTVVPTTPKKSALPFTTAKPTPSTSATPSATSTVKSKPTTTSTGPSEPPIF